MMDSLDISLHKIPPQSIEAEESLLSSILIDSLVMPDIMDILSPDDFYRSSHQKIFSIFIELYDKQEPIDLVTATNALKEKGLLEDIGGASYLANLTDIPVALNTGVTARIVENKSIKRKIIKISQQMSNACFEDSDSGVDISDDAIQKLMDFDKTDKSSGIWLRDSTLEAIETLEDIQDKGVITGIPSGYEQIDKITYGFQKSDFIVIAGRPGSGKSSLALNMADNASRQGEVVIVYELEMPHIQLTNKTLARNARINTMKFRQSNLSADDWHKITNASSKICDQKIFINDNPDMSYLDIRRSARKYKKKFGATLIIIDYLQLVSGDRKEGREREISSISRNFKCMAKELDLPVIALSQLNRQVESRSVKKPVLSDLRESGSLEQDSDMVLFIYRDEMYNKDENNPNQGRAEVMISKHRNGSTGTAYLQFKKEQTAFENLSYMEK